MPNEISTDTICEFRHVARQCADFITLMSRLPYVGTLPSIVRPVSLSHSMTCAPRVRLCGRCLPPNATSMRLATVPPMLNPINSSCGLRRGTVIRNQPNARNTQKPASDARRRIPENDADCPAVDHPGLSPRSFDTAAPWARIAPDQEIRLGSLQRSARSIRTKAADARPENTTTPGPGVAGSEPPTRRREIECRLWQQSVAGSLSCIGRIPDLRGTRRIPAAAADKSA